MTPKEKAKELVIDKYGSNYPIICKMGSRNMYRSEAKQCALIAVDELISEYQSMSDMESVLVINNKPTFVVHQMVYWMEVKQNIEKL